jgi:hypothetical protein
MRYASTLGPASALERSLSDPAKDLGRSQMYPCICHVAKLTSGYVVEARMKYGKQEVTMRTVGMWQEVWNTMLSEFSDISDATHITRITLRLLVAAVLGGLLGYEREQKGKSAGVRTHMLVAIGAALFVVNTSTRGGGLKCEPLKADCCEPPVAAVGQPPPRVQPAILPLASPWFLSRPPSRGSPLAPRRTHRSRGTLLRLFALPAIRAPSL